MLLVLLILGCEEDGDRDYVVELDYDAQTLESGHKRRIDLLRGGVRMSEGSAVESIWRNALGQTFVARRPHGSESGITGLRVKRKGLPAQAKVRGLSRNRFGRLVVDPAYHIVDVFSSRDTYLNSALADTAMSGRKILHHLGLAKRLSEQVDKHYLGPDEQLFWRELLPVVLGNDGYSWIYIPEESEEDDDDDELEAMGRRYDVVAVEDFVMVGEQRGGQSYWHVFTSGQDYVTTALNYGGRALGHTEALRLLGLPRGAAP